jgi:hypothetical protein
VATYTRIVQHDWQIEDFARTETLKATVEHYQADVASGHRSKAAAYELAIARAHDTDQPVRKGDRITYYITGTTPNVTTFENARLAAAWGRHAPDENTAYYLKRLDECARRFAPFFTAHDFAQVFAPDDLFGFSPAGVHLQTTIRNSPGSLTPALTSPQADP